MYVYVCGGTHLSDIEIKLLADYVPSIHVCLIRDMSYIAPYNSMTLTFIRNT